MATPTDQDKKLKALIYLLSRCDSFHDFVGGRSVLSREELLSIFDADTKNPNPLHKNILNIFPAESDLAQDIETLLSKSSSPLVSVKLPKTNARTVKRSTQIAMNYEPRVVLFYELYEDYIKELLSSQGNTTTFNLGKFVSSADIPIADLTSESRFQNVLLGQPNILAIKLGTTTKKQEDHITRNATGIFKLNVAERGEIIYSILKVFYDAKENDDIKFIVDVSSVSFSDLGLKPSETIVCNIASSWDSASKSAACVNVDEANTYSHHEDAHDVFAKTLFSLNNINLEKEKATLTTNTNKKIIQNIQKAIVEVTPLSECISSDKHNCYPSFSPLDLLDVKRSGDGFQVLMTKKLATVSNDKYVFVTVDHLAFLKARLNGVNAIFTTKDKLTDDKLFILYKGNVVPDDAAVIHNMLQKYDKVYEEYNTLHKSSVNINHLKGKLRALVDPTIDNIPINQISKFASFINSISGEPTPTLSSLFSGIDMTPSFEALFQQINNFKEINGVEIPPKFLTLLQSIQTNLPLIFTNLFYTTFYIEVVYQWLLIQRFLNDLQTISTRINTLNDQIQNYTELERKHKDDTTPGATKKPKGPMSSIMPQQGNLNNSIIPALGNLNVGTSQGATNNTATSAAYNDNPLRKGGAYDDEKKLIAEATAMIEDYINKHKAITTDSTEELLTYIGIDVKGYTAILKKIKSIISSAIYRQSDRGINYILAQLKNASTSRIKTSLTCKVCDIIVFDVALKIVETLVSFAQAQTAMLPVTELGVGAEEYKSKYTKIVAEAKRFLSTLQKGGGTEETLQRAQSLPEPPAERGTWLDIALKFDEFANNQDFSLVHDQRKSYTNLAKDIRSFHSYISLAIDIKTEIETLDNVITYINQWQKPLEQQTETEMTRYYDSLLYYVSNAKLKFYEANKKSFPAYHALCPQTDPQQSVYSVYKDSNSIDNFITFMTITSPKFYFTVNNYLMTDNTFDLFNEPPKQGGGDSIPQRFSLADYHQKYYKTYYDLYHKKK